MADSDSATTFVFYRYKPSMVAAVIFIILFAISTLVHIVMLIRKRTWYFIPFVIGCLFETVGYIGRALSSPEYPNFTTKPYIIQSVLLLLGPTLYAASIYMILGRLVVHLDADSYSLIKPKWLTKFFVLGDLISFFAQGGGGGILTQAKSLDDVRRGENIIVGGLAIQILFFGFFMIVTLVFHRRISGRPTRTALTLNTPWRKLIIVLYVSSSLIMVRSIYRVAEYVMGSAGELQAKEVYLYVLDALPMFVVALSYNVFHPSRVVGRESKDQVMSVTSLEVLGETR
ncbi:RTA1 like protein [Annulohypoxylon maeteangense]|uniref:RTA1 like protein n=1 Tax=Annulohypoxylon maeteangense TaxID=1927788 RepID=UPI002007B4D6|nr:RTA1 like protein [Annulohypoxylon maeteangense]KAI0880918.1 RTA1 like protein [Annulohypoxylon maeteangense]